MMMAFALFSTIQPATTAELLRVMLGQRRASAPAVAYGQFEYCLSSLMGGIE